MNILKSTLVVASVAIVVSALGLSSPSAFAQQAEDTPVRTHITVTSAEAAAASSKVKGSAHHMMATHFPGAGAKAAALNAESLRQHDLTLNNAATAKIEATAAAALTAPYFFPADLVHSGGATLTTTANHALYVDYTGTVAANWGNPEGFLTDLGKSTFIHLTDQYTGLTTAGRYTVGGNASISYSYFGNVLYEHDLWAMVYAGAKRYGSGAGHLYHVFLPKGTDTCFDLSAQCYSPDNSNTFYFCGYHSYVTFSDIGTVYFTAEPYQDVPGCQVATPSPNSQLIDSTNSVLSHEVFEAITDPGAGSGWVNRTSADLYGYEIGDECQGLGNSTGALDPTFLINGKKYEVQTEYSNTYHACAVQP